MSLGTRLDEVVTGLSDFVGIPLPAWIQPPPPPLTRLQSIERWIATNKKAVAVAACIAMGCIGHIYFHGPKPPKAKKHTTEAKPFNVRHGEGYILDTPQQQSRTQQSLDKPPAPPITASEDLAALHAKLQNLLPNCCRAFEQDPPADSSLREFEHKRLSELILTHILLKLDAVHTESGTGADFRHKELVRETQSVLTRLDSVVRGRRLDSAVVGSGMTIETKTAIPSRRSSMAKVVVSVMTQKT